MANVKEFRLGIDGTCDFEYDNNTSSSMNLSTVQSLVSDAGNARIAALLALTGGPSNSQTPQLVDSYQAHGDYTIAGSVGSASTLAARNAAGSRVQIPSDGSGTSNLSAQRTSALQFTPADTGVWVWGANVQGLCAGTWLTIGNNMAFGDNVTTPVYPLGQRYHAVHASEFASYFAGSTPASVTAKLTYSMAGVTGPVTWQPGPLWCNAGGQTTFVIIFDDFYSEILTTAFPIMQSLGLVGTVMTAKDVVGTAGRMSLAEARILLDAGWSFCTNATPDDTSALVADAAGLVNALNIGRKYLVDNNLARNGSQNYGCWPNDARSQLAYTAAHQAGMRAMRSSQNFTLYDGFGLGDISMSCPSMTISSTTTESVLVAALDKAVLRGSTQLMHTHRVMDSGATGANSSTAVFKAGMERVAALIAAGLARNLTMPDWHRAVSNNRPPAVYA